MKSENNLIVRTGLTIIIVMALANILTSCVSMEKQTGKQFVQDRN